MIDLVVIFFFQAKDGIRDGHLTGVQTCALPISDDQKKVLKPGWDSVEYGRPHGWSHDGTQIYFIEWEEGESSLWSIDVRTGRERLISRLGPLRSEERRVGRAGRGEG